MHSSKYSWWKMKDTLTARHFNWSSALSSNKALYITGSFTTVPDLLFRYLRVISWVQEIQREGLDVKIPKMISWYLDTSLSSNDHLSHVFGWPLEDFSFTNEKVYLPANDGIGAIYWNHAKQVWHKEGTTYITCREQKRSLSLQQPYSIRPSKE